MEEGAVFKISQSYSDIREGFVLATKIENMFLSQLYFTAVLLMKCTPWHKKTQNRTQLMDQWGDGTSEQTRPGLHQIIPSSQVQKVSMWIRLSCTCSNVWSFLCVLMSVCLKCTAACAFLQRRTVFDVFFFFFFCFISLFKTLSHFWRDPTPSSLFVLPRPLQTQNLHLSMSFLIRLCFFSICFCKIPGAPFKNCI